MQGPLSLWEAGEVSDIWTHHCLLLMSSRNNRNASGAYFPVSLSPRKSKASGPFSCVFPANSPTLQEMKGRDRCSSEISSLPGY